MDFQHQLTLSESNGLVWGVGFRESGSRSSGTFSASLRPDPNHPLYSGFVQDQHSFAFERQWFAANGYAVLAVNYRGSSGRGAKFSKAIFQLSG